MQKMKKVVWLLAVVVMTMGFVSCNNDDENPIAEKNLELRAETLGFPDVESYKTCVAEQCRSGNHENCDICEDGTHEACAYHEHLGTKHDGSHHNGTDHCKHHSGGHSHHSHDGGRH